MKYMFYIWHSVQHLWARIRQPRLVINLSPEALSALQHLAWQQRKGAPDLAEEIILGTLEKIDLETANRQHWEALTPRQQEVAALICLGYTNRQIAAKLHLSPPTVKTHVQNVFHKFGVSRRIELANLLAGWDFQEPT